MKRTTWTGIYDPVDFIRAAGLPEPGRPVFQIRDIRKIRCNCVYFVWCGEEIVYIGKTGNLQNRMAGHHKGFSGDEPISIVAFDSIGAEGVAENIYIAAYAPAMNQVIKESNKKSRKVIA